ncbi:MAG: S9 family peptidase, partial [Ktedonobacterales bacterium]
ILLITGDTGGAERTQFFLIRSDGTGFTPLTDRPDVIYQFGDWSADGQRICYASNERDARYFDIYEREIHVDADSGSNSLPEPRRIYQHDGTNSAINYSPDGKFILIERTESNTRNALLLIDIATGEARRLTPEIDAGPAEHSHVHWSADGAGLYLLSNRGRQFLSLAYLDIATADLIYLREDQWDAEELALTHDGSHLALVTNDDGYSRLSLFDISGGWENHRDLPTPELRRGVIREVSWSRDGALLAFTLDAEDDTPDVWVWDLNEQALWRATRSARGGLPHDAFIAPSLVRFPTFDGRQIPAFFYAPPGVEPRNLPVILYVHGGPESQFRPAFNPILQYLVNHGYGVLAPNVRGSTGYGFEYQSLDDIRLRMDSVADLRSAALWLAESGTADPKHIAIMGRSYGGFMVLAAVTTYPDLWAAGVDIVGIANWVSFLEHTGRWRRKWRETEYGSLENDREFLEEISPIRHVERITAPLFVVHGANDPRVPVGEAEQVVAALRVRDVPVEYLRFEDEGHQFAKRSSNLATYPAVARFLDAYLR